LREQRFFVWCPADLTVDERQCDTTKTSCRKIALVIAGFFARCVHRVTKEMDMEQFKVMENYKARKVVDSN
jgi:hypothetical protein